MFILGVGWWEGTDLFGFLSLPSAWCTHSFPPPRGPSADADRQIIDAVGRAKPKLQPESLRNRVMEKKSNGKWSSNAGKVQKAEQGLMEAQFALSSAAG